MLGQSTGGHSVSDQYNFQNVNSNSMQTGNKVQSRAGLQTGMKGESRPLTSAKGAGFKNKLGSQESAAQNLTTKVDFNKKDQTPEENFRKLEREVNQFVEDSAVLSAKGNHAEALEKAKEAVNKEKQLRRLRENSGTADQINPDLTFCVLFNLANQYQNNGMLQEALNNYTQIVKNKQYPQGARLRVNMGNIYFQQKKYSVAIKMYRMALDQIQKSSNEMRFKILKNIGHAFVKLGKFQDAIASYESILEGSPDFVTAFNLILCVYALGDKKKLKKYFTTMLSIEVPTDVDEITGEQTQNDKLKEELKARKREAHKYIVDAAKLIAPIIEDDVITAYDWILEALKNSQYSDVESEIEITKALSYLKKKDIEKAIDSLKQFEKKDKDLMARASTNISFLYFMENDIKNAEKYAEIALEYDRYNAKALVNKGNCLFMRNEFLRSKDSYLEAIGVEADCIEALYNLAFVNKKINMFMEALQALDKLQTIVSSSPEVIYQIASIHELVGNSKNAIKWYQILLTKVPSDPGILLRMGAIYSREEDEHQALHYYTEAYKYLPTNIETISWLGIYYANAELYEKAYIYFERAAQIQPKVVKWRLMVASCHRRIGSLNRALKLYEEIYNEAPDNIECLKFLVQISKDMGLKYDHYAAHLKKLERQLEAEQARFSDFNNEDYGAAFNQGLDQDEGFGNAQMYVGGGAESNKNQRKIQAKHQENDDDWANQGLDDEMLPS